MDVWAWESPAWAEATSIVNCPIARLSLFRTGRGGGEQRIGQGGGNHNSRAGQDGRATELHIVYCVGFTESPAVASGIAAYVAVSRSVARADGGRFFFLSCRGWFSSHVVWVPARERGQSNAMQMQYA